MSKSKTAGNVYARVSVQLTFRPNDVSCLLYSFMEAKEKALLKHLPKSPEWTWLFHDIEALDQFFGALPKSIMQQAIHALLPETGDTPLTWDELEGIMNDERMPGRVHNVTVEHVARFLSSACHEQVLFVYKASMVEAERDKLHRVKADMVELANALKLARKHGYTVSKAVTKKKPARKVAPSVAIKECWNKDD